MAAQCSPARLKGGLTGAAQGPPTLRLCIGGDSCHVRVKVLAVVFRVAEQQVFRLPQINAVVAHLRLVNALQHSRSNGRVQTLVFSDVLGVNTDPIPFVACNLRI